MAVIKRGEHIQDIRGGSKNHVYSDWRGRGYVRSKAINPSNPRSSAQAGLRARMPACNKYWKSTLTDAQRALWNEYAQSEGNIKGTRSMARQIIPPQGMIGSGFNMFNRNNIALYSAGILAQNQFQADAPTLAGLGKPTPPTSLSGSWLPPPAVHFYENFEDEAIGAKPNTWTPPWTYTEDPNGFSDITVQATPTCTGTKIARFRKTVAVISLTYATRLVPQFVNDGVYVRYYARAAQVNEACGLLFLWRGHNRLLTNATVQVTLGADGNIYYRNGGFWISTGIVYNTTHCYKIEYVLHDSVFKYDLWIDDVLIGLGLSYRNNVSSDRFMLFEIQRVSIAVYLTDDIIVEAYRNRGLTLTWTDSIDIDPASKIRIWIDSYDTSVHLQHVASVDPGVEAYLFTNVRMAKGSSVPIGSLPGRYRIQIDQVDPGGQQSAPSNLINVTVT
ncbi:hypothetical protein ES708_05895 [subsurface metagenome]